MDPKVLDKLKEEEMDEKLSSLLEYCRQLVKSSRSRMQKMYQQWDWNEEAYKAKREPDRQDVKASAMKQPIKQVLPLSKAQVHTFCAFNFMLLTQQEYFYNLEPTGSEDYKLREVQEQMLERDLRHNQWPVRLYQFLYDLAKRGISVIKDTWVVEKQYVPVKTEATQAASVGMTFTTGVESTEPLEVTSYEGNKIINVSPYNFFPDPSVPLVCWKDGKFCADETEVNKITLMDLERKGIIAGVEHIRPMTREAFNARGVTRLSRLEEQLNAKRVDENNFLVCLTTIQVELNPKQFGLGEEDYYMKWEIWIANDTRIIKAVPMGYIHNQWTYSVGMFTPDQYAIVAESLVDDVAAMQDIASFFFNSRLMAVRRALDNKLVVDESAVRKESLTSPDPYILVTKSAARLGVSKFVHQLPFADSTANNIADINVIISIMQLVTGINDNAMGQFSRGRRSSFEAQAVNNGAASRLKALATVYWAMCFQPLGIRMTTNQRQGISQEEFVRSVGQEAAQMYPFFAPQDPRELVASRDFFIMDTTIASERIFSAQALQEILVALLGNPEAAFQLDLSPQALLQEIQSLRGIHDFKGRFSLKQNATPEELQGIIASVVGQQSQQTEGGAGVAA